MCFSKFRNIGTDPCDSVTTASPNARHTAPSVKIALAMSGSCSPRHPWKKSENLKLRRASLRVECLPGPSSVQCLAAVNLHGYVVRGQLAERLWVWALQNRGRDHNPEPLERTKTTGDPKRVKKKRQPFPGLSPVSNFGWRPERQHPKTARPVRQHPP